MADLLFAPAPHDEAVDFIKSKPALTKAAFNRLLPDLKGRAFTIAGIECAETLQRVRDTVAELPAGGDWEQLKQRIIADVSPFFVTSDDPEERAKEEYGAERRAELLLRTHGQQAYSASRYKVMDAQREVLPYWQYQTLGDARVRDTHAALDKVIMPADSSFWQTHFPPWDWGCRCTAIPLSPEDVEEIQAEDKSRPMEARQWLDPSEQQRLELSNIIVRHADPASGKGFPTPFNVQSPAEAGKPGAFTWQPGTVTMDTEQLQKRVDPDVWKKFQTWAQAEPIPGEKRTVWEWLAGKGGHGGAGVPPPAPVPAPAAPDPIIAAIQPFHALKHGIQAAITAHRAVISAAEQELKAVVGVSAKIEASHKVVAAQNALKAAVHQIIELPAAERSVVPLAKAIGHERHTPGVEFVRSLSHKDVFSGVKVAVKRTRERACADPLGKYINGKSMSAKTVAHELGHIIEARNKAILAKSIAFLQSRTAGETAKWMGPGYGKKEITKDDQWVAKGGSRYSGKQYFHQGRQYATEILSMGLERIYADPAAFFEKDPDYFEFTLNTLRGL